jgi:hypothetical protein
MNEYFWRNVYFYILPDSKGIYGGSHEGYYFSFISKLLTSYLVQVYGMKLNANLRVEERLGRS